MNQPADDDVEKWRTLLLALLTPIRRAKEIPPLSDSESMEVAEAAWNELLREYPDTKHDEAFHPNKLKAGLDAAVGRQPATTNSSSADDSPHALSIWLQNFLHDARAIDPQTVEIVGLMLEGFDPRAISEGLSRGLRLVHRIISDIQHVADDSRPTNEVAPC